MATTIEYDSKCIATLDNGQTATLKCAGKKAVTDIIVPISGKGTITYNGVETAIESSKVAYLSCAGKKLLTDVIVKSSVTNLTGTTWRLPIGWECDAGVGKFRIEGECQWKHIDANSPGLTDPVRFWLGYNSDGEAVANCFTTYTDSLGGVTGVYNITNDCEITKFAITGGEDVTNPTLIDWLYKYCRPAMPTAMMKGVWILNSYENLALGDQSVSQDVNYTIDGIDYYRIWYTIGSSWNTLYLRSDVDGASKTIYSDEPHNWKRLELDFGDAPQVVSDKFYAWFTANATKKTVSL
jgi:hypothetical protein